jgi:tRNA1(Val) A37 N6-methylase TrmN6
MSNIIPQYSELSLTLTSKLHNNIKKSNGIYFTPLDIIKKTVDFILSLKNIHIDTVLEPSCGSCEYIRYLDDRLTEINIVGVENNDLIYNDIKNISDWKNDVILFHSDYLSFNDDKLYDLIIGNPPYFVYKEKFNKEYKQYFTGRANIFILFIVHSLKKLNKNGILSFVLPKSFTNCLYYDKLRQYIYENYTILNIFDCSEDNKYLETEQNTIILIIQNTPGENSLFSLENNSNIIFNTKENIEKIKELYNNTTTLKNLNFDVYVGTVVWNQNKDLLTDDTSFTRLIYSSDIVDNTLVKQTYKNAEKKNHIKKDGRTGMILVVNRGYGVGKYKFNFCLIDNKEQYLIENHLICIEYKQKTTKKKQKEMYNMIIKSLNSEKTSEFISIFFGNNAVNCTELKTLFPIYI